LIPAARSAAAVKAVTAAKRKAMIRISGIADSEMLAYALYSKTNWSTSEKSPPCAACAGENRGPAQTHP
jgi:hypothetical protein